MANAVVGRVLLIPKGNYSEAATYNMLDLVRYNNKSWVCKQNCTGQTPSSNEYWFLLCQDGASGTVGSIWYTGTGITGTSTTPTIFSGSGVTSANAADMYLNSSTGNVYQCTTGGNAATAEWVFVISLGGTASWASIADKPFNTIGSNGLIVATDVLDVDLLKIERKASTLTSKATVVLADEMVIADSADSSITKRSPFSALKTLFDTLYNNYTLPTASDSVKGGIKIGTNLTMDGDTLNAAVKGLIMSENDFYAQTGSTSQAVDSFILKEILDDMNGIALTSTLTASATSITLTDAAIVTGNTVKYDYYTDVYGVSPTAVSLSAGSMTLTFDAQTVDVAVRVEIREV